MPRGRRKAPARKAATPPPQEEEEAPQEEPAAEPEPQQNDTNTNNNAADESMQNDGMEEEDDDDEPESPPTNRRGRRTPAAARATNNNTTTQNNSDEDGEPTPTSEEDSVLKVLLSTDNHLGYNERDPIRGMDSFAALEEVLSLARQNKVDLVLLSGDLFHDNKPSRKTLHTTMEILRRYCLGSDAVKFQIVSDQKECLRSVVSGRANYEDEFYSVDLPIFTIHGNHDDPTRDGGPDLLSAVDLLSVSNLVNYFGRQDEVDNIKVSPVLLQKGDTKVALYGMGSMRDERLNRMWQGKKVKFLRPEHGSTDEDEQKEWFNIFTLHQNRDLGRGSKNCVHESMIPEWMDLVVWGHEHECIIDPQESLVGTFRISQPGSSVATSLTAGESKRKQVGLLEIKGQNFRLQGIPLSCVRSFAVGEVNLGEKAREQGGVLDIEDPKVEERMSEVLASEVDTLIKRAREEADDLVKAAEEKAAQLRSLEDEFDDSDKPERKYSIKQPEKVLVRLKVEHSGFSTLNNQRFGSQFVGEVANPGDILLFHKRRQAESAKGGKATRKKRGAAGLNVPTEPEDLADVNIEDLVTQNLVNNEKKLELLDEKSMGEALELYVEKKDARAIKDRTEKVLMQNQKILMKRSRGGGDDGDATMDNPTAVREVLAGITGQKRADYEMEREEEQEEKKKKSGKKKANSKGGDDSMVEDSEEEAPPTKKKARTTTAAKKKTKSKKYDDDSDDMDFESEEEPPPKKRATKKKAPAKKKASRRDDSDDDSDIEFMGQSQATSVKPSRSRTARATTKKAKYNYDDSDVEEINDSEEEETPAPKARGKKKVAGSVATTKARAPSQTQSTMTSAASEFTSTRKPAASGRGRRNVQYLDSDSDDDEPSSSFGTGGAWGTASQSTKGRSRR